MRRGWVRPVIALLLVAAGIVAARSLGLGDLIRLENVARLKLWIEGYGALAPAIYVVGYILATVFFVPGLPITVLGGVAFGPLWGTLYVWIGATIGAGLAFLVARYAVRSTVERWVQASPRIAKVDGQAAKHGWRIVMLTRLVPIFPFNLQNYAYGITRIGFWPYLITSSICILPGTAAFTFAGGALSDGRGDVRRTLAYLAIAGVLLVLISLIPRWLQRRSKLAGDLLKAAVIAALLGVALPADAAGDDAYARLLKAHVRPGTASGIKLALVDYRAVKADPAYAQALNALAESRPDALTSDAERIAFWVNAYNLAAIKAVLDQYPTKSIRDGGSLLSPIWKKKVATVGGVPYALDDIEHGILRKAFREPRVHFAIVCASLSCPDLRAEPFDATRLDTQLDQQAAAFLSNATKGLKPGADGKTARASSIFKWFAGDFAASGGVAAFIRAKSSPDVAARFGALTDVGLSYLDYDWSLNDTARSS
ncbi:MAG: VTT domain-containing protein [Candidatus Rokubacteria bacterium]|nr:VTT domain-containing protein [Candidatus Rokubacteria bacterium]